MAGKNPKPKKPIKRLNYKNLKPLEVLCPVCRTIFVEPVTLPCDHAFCRECFEDTMENVNLGCPLCRNRVSSWVRTAKKADKFIDKEFWTAIQRQYPKELKNKYNGIDNDFETETPVIIVASPGVIREEYEMERKKDLEEQIKLKVKEEQASAALINKLNAEEAYKKQVEEEKLKSDELLARKLQEELNTPSTSRWPRLAKMDSAKKAGPMDRFVKSQKGPCKSPSNASPGQKPKKLIVEDRKVMCISSGDNSDIIDQECRFYFKPIDLHKKYHKPGKVPLKVPAVKGIRDKNHFIRPPSGDQAKMGYGQSAFAWFVSGLSKDPEIKLEKEVSTGKDLPSTTENSLAKIPKKTSTSFDNTKLPKKRAILSSSENKNDNLQLERNFWNSCASRPGPTTRRSRMISPTFFCGFSTGQIKDSENVMNSYISKCKNLTINNIPTNLESKPIKKQKLLQPKSYPIDINRNIPKSTILNNSAVDSINGEINGLSPESPIINNFIGKKIIIQFTKPSQDSVIFDTPPGDFDSSDSEEDIILSNLIDSICKSKLEQSSPPSPKKAKKSPKKEPLPEAGTSKLNNNVDIDVDLNQDMLPSPESCFSNATPEDRKRKRQEKDDFALAKKLQAEFDRIHVLSTTRRGTKRRQATLDEMCAV